ISYLNNILTVPIMFAGVAELSPGHLETIDTLISELEQHGHSRAALNELKNNFEVVSNTSSFSGDYYIPDLQVEHTEAVTQSMSDVLQQADYVDRKSTRLNSSHVKISYAVFCLKKKKKN